MTEPGSDRLRGVVALLVATIGFGLALALRERFDPWRSTALAAVVAAGCSCWALGPRLHPMLRISARGAIGAVLLGVVLVVATHAAFQLVVAASPEVAHSVRALYRSVDVGSSPVTLALLTTVVVAGEELVWRGVAIELAGTMRSRATIGAISVVLYVLPQLAGGVPVLILAAAGLGSLFAAQRIATGRLVDPLLTHLIWSVAIFVAFPLAR